MPIYEFKCIKCEEVFELLQLGQEDVETACPKCGSEDFERIMSSTNFAMGPGGVKTNTKVENRTCSSGSCTTWNIPGGD